MKNIEHRLTSIIEMIYGEEIPCRIEWMYDSGFTWSIQNGDYPRIWKDNHLTDDVKIIAETPTNVLLKNNPLLEKDWIERGYNYSLTEAIKELSEAICKNFPDTKFAKWFLQ